MNRNTTRTSRAPLGNAVGKGLAAPVIAAAPADAARASAALAETCTVARHAVALLTVGGPDAKHFCRDSGARCTERGTSR
ncbi:hypothetical protein HNQ79_005395 [Streptomyces candidus]|uniref:Uncharacterized protein n=1 Tax=Streptomyces candidus TaxID=67283 RepID=A0A7X0LRQ0_9ACTN|nr:hypothetical protein [Streptomyces candidus]GHH52600.1 hypothetical protein GCM10018773_52890 [Streptomyces candidus]